MHCSSLRVTRQTRGSRSSDHWRSLLALGVFHCGAQNFDAIGGTADIDWPRPPIASEAYDPNRSKAGRNAALRRAPDLFLAHSAFFLARPGGVGGSCCDLT